MSARGGVAGAAAPHTIVSLLPAIYRDDDVTQRFTAALDEVLAPVMTTLDCLPAYVDPRTAPADFVGWLASWVGVTLDETWPLERQRALVARAVELFRRRGTVSGVRDLVALYTGVEPELSDGGGTSWSSTPRAAEHEKGPVELVVRLAVDDPATLDDEALERLVRSATPAHVPVQVLVTRRRGGRSGG